MPRGSAPSRSAIAWRKPVTASSAFRSGRLARPRLESGPVSVSAMARPTSSGVCVPPGPSKWASPLVREGKRARTASTSKVTRKSNHSAALGGRAAPGLSRGHNTFVSETKVLCPQFDGARGDARGRARERGVRVRVRSSGGRARVRGAGRRPGDAARADDELFPAGQVAAVEHVLRRFAAGRAAPDDRGVVAEVDGHPLVEHVERAVPEAVVAERLAVAHDAAVELVDLAEAAFLHQTAEHLAADAAGAVGDDGLVLEVVVLAAVELGHELAGVGDIRDDGVREAADLGLEGVAPVEEDHIVPALGHELVQFGRGQLRAAAHHARGIHPQLARRAEAHDLLAHLHDQAREVKAPAAFVERGALAPFEVDLLERRVVAGLAHVALEGLEVAADRAVEPVPRDQDATADAERLAEVALPEAHGLGVGERREDVVQEDLRDGHHLILPVAAWALREAAPTA